MEKKQHDIILGIFGYLGPGFRFPADTHFIHEGFYTLKQNKKYASLLKDIDFYTTSDFGQHVSRALDNMFTNLIIARLIYIIGPDMREYEMPTGVAEYINKNGAEMFGKNNEKVKEASQALKQLLIKKNLLSLE